MKDNEFLNHTLDLLQSFGPVTGRKMFGGYGLFLDGLMFAIIVDDILYFKSDAHNASHFDELALPSFVYNRQGKDVVMSFRLAPDAALEDEEEMTRWAGIAMGAANRNAAHNKKSQ